MVLRPRAFRVRSLSAARLVGLAVPVVEVNYLDEDTARTLTTQDLESARSEYVRLQTETGYFAMNQRAAACIDLIDAILAVRHGHPHPM